MSEYVKSINAIGQKVLIISDLHFPVAHPDWYIFLKEIKRVHRPDIVINVGDEVNGAGISFHDKDSALPNADAELEKAIEEIQYLHELFPKMYLCESNHGSLVFRRIKHHGIPMAHIRPLHELYNTPKWSWHHEILLRTKCGDVSIVHGKTGGYNKLSMEQGCSAIQGHFHQKFEITWHESAHGSRFNMIVGCLIDKDSIAFNYGKNFSKKPILGVGFIDKSGDPFLIRMRLNKKQRWVGEL
jgi:hypothetical protein